MKLDELFKPKRIAVVGSVDSPTRPAYWLLTSLTKSQFPGQYYIVCSSGGQAFNKNIITDIKELPEGLDVIFLCVPGNIIPMILRSTISIKPKYIAVMTCHSQFMSNEKDVNKTLCEARASGIRILGPDSGGLFCASSNFNATFVKESIEPLGNIAFIVQDPALFWLIKDSLKYYSGVGFNKIVSLGDEYDISMPEVLDSFSEDKDISVIGVIIESIKDIDKFLEIATLITLKIPIVAWVVHKKQYPFANFFTKNFSRFSSIRSSEIYESVCKQGGVIVTQYHDEFFALVSTLSNYSNCFPQSRNICLTTNSKAIYNFMDFLSHDYGFEIPHIKVKSQIKSADRSSEQTFSNPFKITYLHESTYVSYGINKIMADEKIGAGVVALTGYDFEYVGRAIVEARRLHKKPILVLEKGCPNLRQYLSVNKITTIPTLKLVYSSLRYLLIYGMTMLRRKGVGIAMRQIPKDLLSAQEVKKSKDIYLSKNAIIKMLKDEDVFSDKKKSMYAIIDIKSPPDKNLSVDILLARGTEFGGILIVSKNALEKKYLTARILPVRRIDIYEVKVELFGEDEEFFEKELYRRKKIEKTEIPNSPFLLYLSKLVEWFIQKSMLQILHLESVYFDERKIYIENAAGKIQK